MVELGRDRSKLVVVRFESRRKTYIYQHVICGKENCTKCPHPPKWYVEFEHNGKRQRFYIGRDLKMVRWEKEPELEITVEELFRKRAERAKLKREKIENLG